MANNRMYPVIAPIRSEVADVGGAATAGALAVVDDAPVTGETITDDQIRQLARWSLEHGAHAVAALRVPHGRVAIAERASARAWCASAWNARHGGSRGG